MDDSTGEIPRHLRLLHSGDRGVEAQLIELIYGELRRIAAVRMRSERPGHTLTPTALVNEAWLRLGSEWQGYVEDRQHFLAVVSTAMRRVLVDHARARQAQKRDGVLAREPVEAFQIAAPESDEMLLALNDALDRLSAINPRWVRVVELRYFSGLSEDEVATVLGLTRRTVTRDWAMARAWLFGELHGGEQMP